MVVQARAEAGEVRGREIFVDEGNMSPVPIMFAMVANVGSLTARSDQTRTCAGGLKAECQGVQKFLHGGPRSSIASMAS